MAESEPPTPTSIPPELLSAMLSSALGSVQGQLAQPLHIYFNGFLIGASWSDIGLTLMLNGHHNASISMSFTTAKTLAKELSNVISEFEAKTQHEIMTMDIVRNRTEPV